MNIFILEDDLVQQQYLKRNIEQITRYKNYQEITIFETSRPSEILEKAQKQVGYNIYFLDIEIKDEEQSGLHLAQKIRKIDPYGWIVFVSTHSEFLPLTFTYKLTALDFIDKTLEESFFLKRIAESLEIAYDNKGNLVAEDSFVFKNQQANFQVPFSEIFYFETTEQTHKIRLVTKYKHMEFYGTLGEVEGIDSRLFRCHRSYIVNTANIREVDRINSIILFENELEQCLVSRGKIKALLNKIK